MDASNQGGGGGGGGVGIVCKITTIITRNTMVVGRLVGWITVVVVVDDDDLYRWRWNDRYRHLLHLGFLFAAGVTVTTTPFESVATKPVGFFHSFDCVVQSKLLVNFLETAPQRSQQFSAENDTRPGCDKPDEENTIRLQVVVDEASQPSGVFFVSAVERLVGQLQVSGDEPPSRPGEQNRVRPVGKTGGGDQEKHRIPEPEENEYFLVEHVDHEHALHAVPLHVAHDTHLKCHTGRGHEN
ncbi:hypothetical protein T4C_11413 [Trichinella pseudospiralis]|uniref:Uncharacterized protein n=1 Tax=Trichinella pseudospiralis TaxID=6337 RepID=A0A0V1K8L1_TRIPS|nr:hypothetical protein T4C_11413 [Trichinella pseudospiralis]